MILIKPGHPSPVARSPRVQGPGASASALSLNTWAVSMVGALAGAMVGTMTTAAVP
jgi:hypothetical protein